MYYRCRRCDREEARGCLPSASCGLYMGFLGSFTLGLVFGVLRWSPIEALGWWSLLLIPVVGVAAMFAGIPLHIALCALEWLAFCLRKCLQCGARRWSWPFTRGFGP